jgi:hypothetical protein
MSEGIWSVGGMILAGELQSAWRKTSRSYKFHADWPAYAMISLRIT